MPVKVNLDVERLVSTEYPRVVAAVRLITGSDHGVADAVQDSIVGLLSTPPRQEPPNYAAWITVAASSRTSDTRRPKDTQKRALPDGRAPGEGGTDDPESLDVDVREVLEGLPQRQRLVAVLYYLLDQSVDEIATSLGITSGTVKSHLHRARSALGALLGRDADDD